MKIAIHHRKGSFSEHWITYCEKNKISYKIVDAYASNIIDEILDCDAFMWHFSHIDYRDMLFAKQLLYSIQLMGKKVFPDFNTVWHFDDKVGQKYMFEAIGVPFIPTYVFYDKKAASRWIHTASMPKVFKLRGGAGASNVFLIRTKRKAYWYIRKAFNNGFPQRNSLGIFKDKLRAYFRKNENLKNVVKYFIKLFCPTNSTKLSTREKGYVYFQDFLPGNKTDTRIVVVGNKIIGERRGGRNSDFRASGSHILLPEHSLVDIECVKLAYKISRRLKLQIGVFDFIHDTWGNPMVVEVSYGTDPDYTECEGYWTSNFDFVVSPIDLSTMIIESFLWER